MTTQRAELSTKRTKDPVFEIPIVAVHRDDRGDMVAQPGRCIDVRSLGRPLWVNLSAFSSIYALDTQTAKKICRAGICQWKRSGKEGKRPRYWVHIDPTKDIQRLYDEWANALPVFSKHRDFNVYKDARRWMRVDPHHPHPYNILLGVAIKLEQIGSFHKTEVAAFLPLNEPVRAKTSLALKDLRPEATQRLASSGLTPSLDSLASRAPRLRELPETAFADDGEKQPNAVSRRYLAQTQNLFTAAAGFIFLFAPKSRNEWRTVEIARAFLRFDQEFTSHHASSDHRDRKAVSDTFKRLICDDECKKRYSYYVRYRTISFVLSSMRQMKRWLAHSDPDRSLGFEELMLATPDDFDEIVALFRAEFKSRKRDTEARRKDTSDRVSDALAEIDDCVLFRSEQLRETEAALLTAAEDLPAEGKLRCAVDTPVLDHKGQIQIGSQRNYWVVWRASSLIPTLRTRKGTCAKEDEQALTSFANLIDLGKHEDELFFEYTGCCPLVGDQSEMPFFVTPFALATVAAPNFLNARLQRIRHNAIVRTDLPTYTSCSRGLLGFEKHGFTLYRYAMNRNRIFVPIREFARAMCFASVAYRLSRDTLARPHEILQLAHDADGWAVKRVRGQAQVGFKAYPKVGANKPLPREPVWFPVSNRTFKEAMGLVASLVALGGHADGELPMVKPLAMSSWKMPDEAPLVFQWQGKALRMGEIALFFRYLLVGWRDLRWYDLRHAGANEMREAGVPMRYISAILNHSDLTISGYYARWTKRQKSKIVGKHQSKMRTIAGDAHARRMSA